MSMQTIRVAVDTALAQPVGLGCADGPDPQPACEHEQSERGIEPLAARRHAEFDE